MAEPDDLVSAPLGTEEQRGKEVWNGTVALADGAPTWTASATCWTSGLIGCVWGTTGAAPAVPCAARAPRRTRRPASRQAGAERGWVQHGRPARGAGVMALVQGATRRDESFRSVRQRCGRRRRCRAGCLHKAGQGPHRLDDAPAVQGRSLLTRTKR
jgi:hypothetical protein